MVTRGAVPNLGCIKTTSIIHENSKLHISHVVKFRFVKKILFSLFYLLVCFVLFCFLFYFRFYFFLFFPDFLEHIFVDRQHSFRGSTERQNHFSHNTILAQENSFSSNLLLRVRFSYQVTDFWSEGAHENWQEMESNTRPGKCVSNDSNSPIQLHPVDAPASKTTRKSSDQPVTLTPVSPTWLPCKSTKQNVHDDCLENQRFFSFSNLSFTRTTFDKSYGIERLLPSSVVVEEEGKEGVPDIREQEQALNHRGDPAGRCRGGRSCHHQNLEPWRNQKPNQKPETVQCCFHGDVAWTAGSQPDEVSGRSVIMQFCIGRSCVKRKKQRITESWFAKQLSPRKEMLQIGLRRFY